MLRRRGVLLQESQLEEEQEVERDEELCPGWLVKRRARRDGRRRGETCLGLCRQTREPVRDKLLPGLDIIQPTEIKRVPEIRENSSLRHLVG
eukprot:383887-Rhodomonas_salina.2